MELLNRIKKIKKNDKGFTLVEIIVVLVILAILAAFTIPTMLGFVTDARGKASLALAREVYVAAQATATEDFANNATAALVLTGSSAADGTVTITTPVAASAAAEAKFITLLGKDLPKAAWVTTIANGKVTKIVYTPDGGKAITIEDGKTTVAP